MDRLSRSFIVVAVLALLSVASCSRQQVQPEAKEPKLKTLLSRTDLVLVKHFYQKSPFAKENTDPKYAIIAEAPGVAEIEPVWAYQPNKQTEGIKGVKLIVTAASWSGGYGTRRGGEECTSYLDLDEVKDMVSAISFMNDAASPWRKGSTDDYIQVSFVSKDSSGLAAFLDPKEHKAMLSVKCGSTQIFVPFERIQDGQKVLQTAVTLLESKQ